MNASASTITQPREGAPKSNAKKVVVIEDQTILRDLICHLVESYPDMKVVAQSGDGTEGYELSLQHQPDLIILDIMLPGLNGVEILRRLKQKKPELNVLIFSAAASSNMVNRLLKAGVTGYIEKNAGLTELEQAIQSVVVGRSYFSQGIVAIMRHMVVGRGDTESLDALTAREREVAQLIAESWTNKEIATRLKVSARTIDTHRTNIMRKLDLHDVAGITRWAIAHQLISPVGANLQD